MRWIARRSTAPLTRPAEPYRILDRITGEEVTLSRHDFDDLCRVHLFDWLEQVPRSQEWDYRRAPIGRWPSGWVGRRKRSTSESTLKNEVCGPPDS